MAEHMVPYELEREARIRRNNARMQALGIPALVAALAVKPVIAKKTRVQKAKPVIPEAERRRSARARASVQYTEDPVTPLPSPRATTGVPYRAIPVATAPAMAQPAASAALWVKIFSSNPLLIECAAPLAEAFQLVGLDPEHIQNRSISGKIVLSMLPATDGSLQLEPLQRLAAATVLEALPEQEAAAAAPSHINAAGTPAAPVLGR